MKTIITVRDVFETRKTLVRLENYARRHMDNVNICEANGNIVEARKLLAANVASFDNSDVTTLTPNNTENLRRIEQYEQALLELKSDKKEIKRKLKKSKDENEQEYLEEDLQYVKEDIASVKVDLMELQEEN